MAAQERVLNLLSLSRRANELVIGQDKIFAAIREGKALVLFAAEDCSENVLRKLRSSKAGENLNIYTLKNTDRELLGRSVGVETAQITALPVGSGLAEKIILILSEDRSDADE